MVKSEPSESGLQIMSDFALVKWKDHFYPGSFNMQSIRSTATLSGQMEEHHSKGIQQTSKITSRSSQRACSRSHSVSTAVSKPADQVSTFTRAMVGKGPCHRHAHSQPLMVTTTTRCSRSSTPKGHYLPQRQHQRTSWTSTTSLPKPIVDADIDLERLVLQYLRQCPPHQKTTRGLPTSSCAMMSTNRLEATSHIQLSDIDPFMQQGSPQPLTVHPSTSAGNRRNQPQDHIIAISGSQ